MSTDNAIFKKLINTNDFQVHRKPLFESLEKSLGAKVISYVANPMHPFNGIINQDIILFEDLLRSVSGTEEGYLIINSPGGDPNVAEKIIIMCRQRFPKSFKVIVPNFAKSAATMIALGSDQILMGYLAELGPIDPQLGNPLTGHLFSARSFIDGLEMIRANIAKGDPIQMYLPQLAQLRPELIAQCLSAITGSKEFAEKWLKECMLKNNPEQAKLVAKWLSEGEKYKSHGKVIDYAEAHNVLKLNVEKIPETSDLWNTVWELYCREMLFLQGGGAAAKLFESDSMSLAMQVQLNFVQQGPPPIMPPPFLPMRLPQQPHPPRAPPVTEPQPEKPPGLQPQQPPPNSPSQ